MPRIIHIHDWQPLVNYQARYRCSTCMAFGYKKFLVTGFSKLRPGAIVPYRCAIKDCGRWAVAKDVKVRRDGCSGYKQWRCSNHRLKEKKDG